EELSVVPCDRESRQKVRELEAFIDRCVLHYCNPWTLSQLPGAFRTYSLKVAFGQYWERNEISEQSRNQSPAIRSLVGLQQRQLVEARELIRQLEGQSLDDLIQIYCSLLDNLQNHRCHSNLTALLLGHVTSEKDNEQIVDCLGACSSPVYCSQDTEMGDSECCVSDPAKLEGDVLHLNETPLPILADLSMVQESTQWRTKVKETLQQLRQEWTFALRSKGERNTASFKELIDPTETEDLTDENWCEFSRDAKTLRIIAMVTMISNSCTE
ncbi:hypothetical protein chiPu_0018340, partial [Chiloscyllium punctatum]|nr:hypothetical protein [Chiloscyllium punctatum]